MALGDDESVVSNAPSIFSNQFTIAARSTASSGSHRNIRHRVNPVPVLPTKKSSHLQCRRFLPHPNNNHASPREIHIGTIQEQGNHGWFAAGQRLKTSLKKKKTKSFMDDHFSATLEELFLIAISEWEHTIDTNSIATSISLWYGINLILHHTTI